MTLLRPAAADLVRINKQQQIKVNKQKKPEYFCFKSNTSVMEGSFFNEQEVEDASDEDWEWPNEQTDATHGRVNSVSEADKIPSSELLNAMIDRLEALLPINDTVTFACRAKKIDWSQAMIPSMFCLAA